MINTDALIMTNEHKKGQGSMQLLQCCTFPGLFCLQPLYLEWPSPSSLTETLSGLLQIKPQDISFPKTIDLPCFPFSASSLCCLFKLCIIKFCIFSVLLFVRVHPCVCVCMLHVCVYVLIIVSMDTLDFALYKYFNYYLNSHQVLCI